MIAYFSFKTSPMQSPQFFPETDFSLRLQSALEKTSGWVQASDFWPSSGFKKSGEYGTLSILQKSTIVCRSSTVECFASTMPSQTWPKEILELTFNMMAMPIAIRPRRASDDLFFISGDRLALQSSDAIAVSYIEEQPWNHTTVHLLIQIRYFYFNCFCYASTARWIFLHIWKVKTVDSHAALHNAMKYSTQSQKVNSIIKHTTVSNVRNVTTYIIPMNIY